MNTMVFTISYAIGVCLIAELAYLIAFIMAKFKRDPWVIFIIGFIVQCVEFWGAFKDISQQQDKFNSFLVVIGLAWFIFITIFFAWLCKKKYKKL